MQRIPIPCPPVLPPHARPPFAAPSPPERARPIAQDRVGHGPGKVRPGWGCWILLLGMAAAAPGVEPGLRVVRSSQEGVVLLHNGNLEQAAGTHAAHWQQAPKGCLWAAGQGRGGSSALRCDNPSGQGWFGASQTLTLNRPTGPLAVRGWSKAQRVGGSADRDYSLYVDLVYTDGTPLWGQAGNFRCGTHDWEAVEFLILPDKPVKTLTLHCLFRSHSGTAWFDDIRVSEIRTAGDATVFQGLPVQPTRPVPAAPPADTREGFETVLHNHRVVSLKSNGKEWAHHGLAGFLARDAAADSDYFPLEDGENAELGLVISTFTAVPGRDHLRAAGRVTSTRATDRAIQLVYTVPVAGDDWRWGDDLRRHRPTARGGEFVNAARVRGGATGTLSLYPVAAVWNERCGLALALDLAQPAVARVGYHAALKTLFIAYDFGLVPDTRHFPNSADFRFVLYRFDPRWGFREAWRRYMDLFPEHFTVRAADQGLWMPFTDVSRVEGWQDFQFKFHEGNNNVPWDDAHGVLSFRYTEPMTWWMKMDPSLPRTPAAATRLRDELAQGQNPLGRRMAHVTRLAAMADEAGNPCLQFRDTPWCNGAVWSLNPNPALGTTPAVQAQRSHDPTPAAVTNAATVHWNPAIRERLYGPQAKGRLDGEYLDSLEGYVTAELNFQRAHFAESTVPLTFDGATKRPALFKGLAVFEFTRWLAEDVHGLGRLMFANGVPYRFAFLCPWLDVLGTETDWLRGGQYQPPALAQMDLWRTLSGAKPYLLLMNTDYDAFTPDLVERYFQRALFYGMFPGMFSHNAADNPYWQTPRWYNRDRPLFKRYLPIVKRVAEAGWHPVPHATCNNPHILLERFGPHAAGAVFLTVYNDTPQPQAGTVRVDAPALDLPAALRPRELLTGTLAEPANHGAKDGWRLQLNPHTVGVLRFDP
ncbi:MAG: hypothetical protein JXQ71_14245 [Verrucomicrobia bacterium]|nr:hypothetical protein [Verrucomicrobiota bacterium]